MAGGVSIYSMITSLKNSKALLNGRGSFKERRDLYMQVEKDRVKKREMSAEERKLLKAQITSKLKRRKIIDITSFVLASAVVVLVLIILFK